MKEAIHEILNAYNGLVSEELIGKYILGRASTEEVRHLEKLIQDDPFLADAIEGLREGDFAVHAANLDQIQSALYKKSPNVFKISIASIAIAASVVLVGYWGLRFSNFTEKSESATAVATDSNKVHKETKIITLKEPAPEPAEFEEKELVPADAPPVNPQKPKSIASDVTRNAEHKEVIALSTHPKPSVSRSAEASKEYISKDKSYEKKEANILMDEDAGEGVLEEESDINTSGYNASKAEPTAAAAPKFVKSLDFNKQALNTQEYLADLAPHPEAQTEEHKSYNKKKAAKPKCDNCPDKQGIAEKNTILDTIATHKAGYLYESGAYEEAARWYARNPDLHSKIMAGVSYLQAGDTSACHKMENVLLKSNTAAAELLKALRMSYLDKNVQALAIYQRLIDNKTVFKELAEKNKQVLSTK